VRILTIVHELPPIGGGGGRSAFELCRELAAAGHDADAVTMAYSGLAREETIEGVRILRAPCKRRKPEISYTDEKLSFVGGALPLVRRLAREKAYDIVHCHFVVPGGLIARLLKRTLGAPYIITCHGSDVPGYNPDYFALEHRLMAPVWRSIVRGAAHVIAPSQTLCRLIEATRTPHLPPVSTVPYGFAAHRFAVSRRENRILLVSRLLPRKGFQYLLQALAGLHLDWEVNIVGDGPYRPELERIAAESQTPVRFWGWLANESAEMRDLYETSSIFVFPSVAENFPVALLEAMSAGLAIIATNTSGSPEVVGDAGVLVPPADSAAIREALVGLAHAPARIATLGDAARRRLEENFDWPIILGKMVRLYSEAAGREGA
jgi:glycosyltransferase involved in cell wall biosynthesis